jgi:hypothetical protein
MAFASHDRVLEISTQVLVQHLFQKPLVLCEMVLALGFLTAIYFSDGFC